jgi:hypothetical protein
MAQLNGTHGESGRLRTPLYNTWLGMLERTSKPKRWPSYINIKVHHDWHRFENFRDYINASLGPRPKGHSLDRIDNTKNYEPGNVRWADPKTQTRNRSSNVMVVIDGVSRCLSEWAEINGLNANVVNARKRMGWPIELAVTVPRGTQLNKPGPKPKT